VSARCDVIIPVKDAVWWVEKCLEELFRCTDPANLGKVLVINDRSSRESSITLEEICSRFHHAELLQNEGPSGFAGACNFAAARSSGPNLLFLNTDCLLTPGTIEKLLLACEGDASIGMACPLSNNSPELTLPMIAGLSYLEMNELLERINQGRALSDAVFDACTVVGNCLLITRKCWETTGPFDQGWGLGYGEETDYQFRAMRLGFRGVVLVNTYVYHYGNASFRYQTGHEELQKRNLTLFHSKWGPDFIEYGQRCSKRDPIRTITDRLKNFKEEPIRADVLFVLEGVSQTIGGVHVVVEICNYLIRHGISAKCLILGELDQSTLQGFAEPILFGLLSHKSEASFLADRSIVTRMIVATLFRTTVSAYLSARMRGVPLVSFVQGYEFLFDNGSVRDKVEQSYWLPDRVVTTSSWLEAGVRLRTPEKPVAVLPAGVEPYLFLPPAEPTLHAKVRIAVFLRREPEKGQAILLEMLDRLLPYRDEISLTVFSGEQPIPRGWLGDQDTSLVRIPVDKGTIARHLRRCDILIDASLHEGFGLIPLEAMACGAAVIASDSGGINDFLSDRHNGLIVKEVNKAERFVAEILRLVHDRRLLASLRAEALKTARHYSASLCYERYAEYFKRALATAKEWTTEAPIVDWVAGDPGMSVVQDLLPNEEQSYILRPRRRHASLIIPGYALPTGTKPILRLEIFSSGPQIVTISLRPQTGSFSPDLSAYLRSTARAVRQLASLRRGSIEGVLQSLPFLGDTEQPLDFELAKGWNEVLVELPPRGPGEPMRLVFGGSNETLLSSLQIRGVDPSREGVSLKERFDASETLGWTLGQPTRTELLVNGMDLLRCPAGLFRAFGPGPSLLLPEVPWPPGGTTIGWIDFSVPEDTIAQLYYRSGPLTEYCQEASLSQFVKCGRNLFPLNLTANLTGRLRFDPGRVKGDYEIHALRLYCRRPSAEARTLIARSA